MQIHRTVLPDASTYGISDLFEGGIALALAVAKAGISVMSILGRTISLFSVRVYSFSP